MKPRSTLLEVPETRRYFCIELERGEHHFRMPRYDLAFYLFTWLSEQWNEAAGRGIEAGSVASLHAMAPAYGAMLGFCWFHRGFELETEIPNLPAKEDYLAVGAGVVDELQEEGYSAVDIVILAMGCLERIRGFLGLLQEAQDEADFTVGGENPGPRKTKSRKKVVNG